MNTFNSPLTWSFPLGTIFATRIRVSYFLGLLFISLMLQFGAQLGLLLSLIVFNTILAHELFGHILIARLTGGSGDEILMWPFGGLAFVKPDDTFNSRFLTAFGGPLVHIVVCMLTYPALAFGDYSRVIFNPIYLPIAELSLDNRLQEILVLIFHVNWVLLLLNLIPVYPMDGGRMLEAILMRNTDGYTVKSTLINLGIVISIVLMLAAVIVKSIPLMLVASLILVMNHTELVMLHVGSAMQFGGNEFGYDFSAGYTSLEKSHPLEEKQPGLWTRWREKRRQAKMKKEIEERINLEQSLDTLLAKVSATGMSSLTPAEQKQLQRVSQLLRERTKSS